MSQNHRLEVVETQKPQNDPNDSHPPQNDGSQTNESTSESSSGSGSDSDSDSDSQLIILKPVFIKSSRTVKNPRNQFDKKLKFDNVGSAVESSPQIVDDTDDLDPEAEYAAWKDRELQRYMRYKQHLQEKDAK